METEIDIEIKRQELINGLNKVINELMEIVDGYIDEGFRYELRNNIIIDHNDEFGYFAHLDRDYEYFLFNNLFDSSHLKSLYHYTSFNNLFEIVNSGKLHLNSLIGLNDKSEINFVNNYMDSGFKDPYHPASISYHNSHFLFCFSKNYDQLTQWRLYGDDGYGVMIEFYMDCYHLPNKNILFSKVRYDFKVFSVIKNWLKYCKESLQVSFSFREIDYWKFFFKNNDYRDENEVRLLIKNTDEKDHHIYEEKFKLNRYNIIVPYLEIKCIGLEADFLAIKSIKLGPKLHEAKMNVEQLRYVLQRKYPANDIEITRSQISHYR